MLERFTQRAREVVVTVAQQHARRIPASPEGGKPEVTVVHVLLALAEERDGLAAEVLHAHGITAAAVRERVLADRKSALDGEALATLGIDLGAVREAIEASFGPGAPAPWIPVWPGGGGCGSGPRPSRCSRWRCAPPIRTATGSAPNTCCSACSASATRSPTRSSPSCTRTRNSSPTSSSP